MNARKGLKARIARNTIRVRAGELTPLELLLDSRTEATRRGWLTRSSRASKWAQVNAAMRACGWSVRDIKSGATERAVDDDSAVEEHVGTLTASHATPLASSPRGGFVRISSLIADGRALAKVDECDDVCNCQPESRCTGDCENSAMAIRCDSRYCPCGVCDNAALHELQGQRIEVVNVGGGRGYGVRAIDDINAGTFIGEYVGEYLTATQARSRKDKSYMVCLDSEFSIDARYFGNDCRFINHGCSPNVKMFKFVDAATTLLCIGLFSLKKVTAGTELTVDYGVDFSTNFECQCGAPGCRNTNM